MWGRVSRLGFGRISGLEPTPWLSNFGGFICIVNEQGARISEAWDGVNLQFTFRRTVNRETMDQWQELVQIANSINLLDEEDAII
jgi:hypothetical protein